MHEMAALEPRGHMGQTITFESPDDSRIFREDIQSDHFMKRRFGRGTVILSYDTAAYDWDAILRELLIAKNIAPADKVRGLDSLSSLHTILAEEWTALDESELNKVSKSFYDNDAAFDDLYRRFIKGVVAEHCGEPVFWQGTPTIRFHFPRQKGFNWRPRYHTDIMLGHPPQEVNVWIPLTNVYGSNSMTLAGLEPSYDILKNLDFDFENFATKVQYDDGFAEHCKDVSRPVELRYGEYVMFDPRCIHATQDNHTRHTRISIDLRVLPRSEHERIRMDYRGTGRRRMLFAPGHYYDSRLSTEL
jgi:hypothetical protein